MSARTNKTLNGYKAGIVSRMKSLGTYKEEYEPTIERTAGLYVRLDKIIDDYDKKAKGQAVIAHTNKAGATNLVKNPLLTALESTYNLLLLHERELGLTPTGLKKINEAALDPPKKANALIQALKEMQGE